MGCSSYSDRTAHGLRSFFEPLCKKRAATRQFISSDLWTPYPTNAAACAGRAVHVVLDRYHFMALMNKASDEVRAADAPRRVAHGRRPPWKRSPWVLLQRPEHLTENHSTKSKE
jgi:transposase